MRVIRKIHRYFALVLGLAFLAWIVSGIMMMLPEPSPDALGQRTQYTYDFAAVVLSPAEVIARLKEQRGAELEVNRIAVRPLKDRLVYEVGLRNEPSSLLDAQTAAPIEITPEFAEGLVRDYLKDDVGRASIETLDRHSATYPWGPLPVYRLEFENGQGTIAYVSQADGKVRFTDWQQQVWRLLISVHEFGPLRILLGSESATRQILLITTVLTLVIVATGYYMEFFPRSRRRKKRASDV